MTWILEPEAETEISSQETGQWLLDEEPEKKESESGVLSNVKEIVPQAATGFGIGALGTYGDILNLFGLQAKKPLPGEQAKRSREFNVLEKIEKGQVPSYGELLELSDEDGYSRLASSADVEQLGKELGLISEPKTPSGRYARRIGSLAGSQAVTFGTGLKAPIAAGVAGQTLEEAGAPKWAQAAAEIVAFLKASPKTTVPITSESPQVKNVINNLRKAGFSEEDITLAKNALEDRKILKSFAKLTGKAEESISNAVKNSEDLFAQQIKKGLPGYAKGGISYLENQAENVYKTMERAAEAVKIKDPSPLKSSLEKSIAYLEKRAVGADQKKTIDYLKDALSKVDKADSAAFFTDLYRGLNKEGKWLAPSQKEHVLRETKDAIMQTFSKDSPQAAKFGKYFEKTNEAWKKWINVQDAMETLDKAKTLDGLDWKKVGKILKDPEKFSTIEKGIGSQQAKNLKSISEGVDSFKLLEKQLSKSKNPEVLKSLKFIEGVRGFLSGDFSVLTFLIGKDLASSFATKILTNKEYQNSLNKIISSVNEGLPFQAALIARNLERDLKKEK